MPRPIPKPITDPRAVLLWSNWISAHADYGVPAAKAEFEAVLAAYGAKGRHYHTAQHLEACFLAIADEPSFARAPDVGALKLAVFFHDLVLDPLSEGNEAMSEARWQDYARRAGFSASVRELVSALILVTADHRVQERSPFLVKAMNDLDMAILAAPIETYREYAQGVWKEASGLGREAYRKARTAFLMKVVPTSVFATEAYRPRAGAVRRNLTWEIRALMEKPELVLGAV